MRVARVHTDQPLRVGTLTKLDPQAAHHLRKVLRLRNGDQAIVFNGDGRDYYGKLELTGRHDVSISIATCSELEASVALSIRLGLGVSRGERMDFAIQKSVELGVDEIIPLDTERCSIPASSDRLEKRHRHWHRIVISACEQSGRKQLPTLRQITPLCEWLHEQSSIPGILLTPTSVVTLELLPHPGNMVNLLVGPEGGLSENECAEAIAHGFQAIRLGPRVLRTETAPLAAIAAAQVLWGDFR